MKRPKCKQADCQKAATHCIIWPLETGTRLKFTCGDHWAGRTPRPYLVCQLVGVEAADPDDAVTAVEE